jgi:hypothetical protein
VFKISAGGLDQKARAKVLNRLNKLTNNISHPNHKNYTYTPKQGVGWIKLAQDRWLD